MSMKVIKSGSLKSAVVNKGDAIIIVEQNGKSTKNEYGGYPTLHVGSEKYIARLWSKMECVA